MNRRRRLPGPTGSSIPKTIMRGSPCTNMCQLHYPLNLQGIVLIRATVSRPPMPVQEGKTPLLLKQRAEHPVDHCRPETTHYGDTASEAKILFINLCLRCVP